MKGTRLWNQAGSPLIQGRSRRERPFARDWLQATVAAALAGGGVMVVYIGAMSGDYATALRAVWMPAIPAAGLGAAAGVWVAKRFGWQSPWIAGAVCGAVFVAGAVAAFSVFLVSRLGN